jgi:predicted RNA-binding Zn-ribbon protein involved in translation (DUF1610 family)
MKRKRIELRCPRCGKEAHILFMASPDFKKPVCIACRNRIREERGLQLKTRRQRVLQNKAEFES